MRSLRPASALSIVLALALIVPAGSAQAAARGGRPAGFILSQQSVDLVRFGDEPLVLDLGLFFSPGPAGLEIAAKRVRWDKPIRGTRLIRSSGTIAHQMLRPMITSFDGLTNFFHVDVADAEGALVYRGLIPFCPNSFDRVRVDPHAPDVTRFPDSCGGSPWTLGQIWGIDPGWAVRAPMGSAVVADGAYTAHVTINAAWRQALGLSATAFDARVDFTVTTETDEGPGPIPFAPARRRMKPLPGAKAAGKLPPPSARPDMVALPAWDIQIAQPDDGNPEPRPVDRPLRRGPGDGSGEPGRDILIFAATVWNAGPSPLVVDGFRRPGEPTMDAYQSFYVKGKRVAVQRTGTMVYDPRPSHQHWHFLDFATHRLLDAGGNRVVLGQKEAFCIAPTDSIDLTVSGAELRPFFTGLQSACGDASSIGIRETMPAGWGDTYGAGTVGQSFDVTDLPNGTYFIEVVANPNGGILERTTSNNTTRRRIELSGTPGNRTVTAAPYYGVNA